LIIEHAANGSCDLKLESAQVFLAQIGGAIMATISV
jgi:hypothetical protein